MLQFLLNADFLKFVIPLAGAIIAWLINENRKRAWEEYERKEENYKELIKSLKGFYASPTPEEKKKLKNQFIDQLNICWLYCPDDVIQKGYAFLNTIHTNKICSDEVKQESLGNFVLAIREDLLKRRISRKTNLKATDFEHFTST